MPSGRRPATATAVLSPPGHRFVTQPYSITIAWVRQKITTDIGLPTAAWAPGSWATPGYATATHAAG